jgi:hypothetical protein
MEGQYSVAVRKNQGRRTGMNWHKLGSKCGDWQALSYSKRRELPCQVKSYEVLKTDTVL